MSPALRISMLLLGVLLIGSCYSASIPNNFDPRLSDDIIMAPKKRPFCNAFTGCGRKRSQNAPGMPVQEIMRQRQDDCERTNLLRGNFTELALKHYLLYEIKRPCEKILFEEDMGYDSDNAIEEISRQILSEAKLWEAIQEASAQIARRKQKEALM